MELWIPITIAAAFLQNLRSAGQKHLKSVMGTSGATFVRCSVDGVVSDAAVAFGSGDTSAFVAVAFGAGDTAASGAAAAAALGDAGTRYLRIIVGRSARLRTAAEDAKPQFPATSAMLRGER